MGIITESRKPLCVTCLVSAQVDPVFIRVYRQKNEPAGTDKETLLPARQ
jgi:hypothetical protein